MIGVVDDVLDAQRAAQWRTQTMCDIERRLERLLTKKLEFRRMCRRFVRGNGKCKAKLRSGIESYLQSRDERKKTLAMIVSDVTRLVQGSSDLAA